MSETEMRERVTRLETTVGEDPGSGLRGWMAKIDIKLDQQTENITGRLTALEKRFYIMYGGSLVVLWIIQHFWK